VRWKGGGGGDGWKKGGRVVDMAVVGGMDMGRGFCGHS
jgi:hypothetical protein